MATFDYNPITGNLDLVGSGASYINGVVADPTALPVTLGTPPLDSVYLAKAGSGVWLINRKPAGLYCRVANNGNANDWQHLGAFPEVNADGNWELYNSADPTKELKFDLSGLPTATTRTVNAPDGNGKMLVNSQPVQSNNGTLTASAPVLDLSQTWNNAAVTFTGLRMNVTNTASGGSSLLADFQVGGTSVLKIGSDGALEARTNQPVHVRIGSGNDGLGINANLPCLRQSGVVCFRVSSTQNYMNTVPLGWASTLNGSADVILAPDAANALAQRNSTNPQTFRLYNTFTDASNYERGFMRWSSNVLQIGTEKGGTGSARALALQTDGITRVTVDTTGQVGIGVAPERPFHIQGSAAFARIDRQGNFGPAILLTRMATGTTVTSSWLFGPTDQVAGVANDDFAIIDFGAAVSGTTGTQRLTISKSTGQLTVNGNLNLSTKDLVTDTTTGTKIGTGTTQKLGFFNATPIVRPAAIADATDAATTQARLNDLLAAMRSLGLIAT